MKENRSQDATNMISDVELEVNARAHVESRLPETFLRIANPSEDYINAINFSLEVSPWYTNPIILNTSRGMLLTFRGRERLVLLPVRVVCVVRHSWKLFSSGTPILTKLHFSSNKQYLYIERALSFLLGPMWYWCCAITYLGGIEMLNWPRCSCAAIIKISRRFAKEEKIFWMTK